MDPNETLKDLRYLIALAIQKEGMLSASDVLHMAELFDALDHWLVQGGFRPNPWRTRDPKENP